MQVSLFILHGLQDPDRAAQPHNLAGTVFPHSSQAASALVPSVVTAGAYLLHQHPPLNVENKVIGRVKQHIYYMKTVGTGWCCSCHSASHSCRYSLQECLQAASAFLPCVVTVNTGLV